MNPILKRLLRALGLLAADEFAKRVNAEPPRKVKLPPPISDREWQGLDDEHPTRPDLELPPAKRRRQ